MPTERCSILYSRILIPSDTNCEPGAEVCWLFRLKMRGALDHSSSTACWHPALQPWDSAIWGGVWIRSSAHRLVCGMAVRLKKKKKKRRRRRRARVCLSRQFVFSCPHGFQGVQGKICAWTGSWVLKAPLPCSSRSWELRVQNLGCDFITHLHLILDATLESQFAGFRVPRLWQPAPSQFEHREIQLHVRKQQQGLGKVFCILCVGFSSWQSLDCRALFF